MTEFNEQEERTKDQPYLDGFNMGYNLQKQLEDKSLSDKDRKVIESLTKVINKSKSDNDKIQGMIDGKKQRLYELELQKMRQASKEQERDNDRGR